MSHATIAFGAIEDARGSISFESGTDVHAADYFTGGSGSWRGLDPLADQLPDEACALMHGVASLPGKMSQAAGGRIVAGQPARAQHGPDLVGKPAYFSFHQSGNCVHQAAEPFSPLGLVEP